METTDIADDEPGPTVSSSRRRWLRIAIAVLFVGLTATALIARNQLQWEDLVKYESRFKEYVATNPVAVFAIAFSIYVAVTGLSIPGATIMSLGLGWLLGFWRALVLVSFASTAGATLAFLLSRYLLRDAIQSRFGDQLQNFNRELDREGAFYLFTLRLIPAVPFFVINAVMGLTPIRASTFWWVSQLGMLPGTCVYIWAGSQLPGLETLADEGARGIMRWQLVLAFALLGVFPLAVRLVLRATRARGAGRENGE